MRYSPSENASYRYSASFGRAVNRISGRYRSSDRYSSSVSGSSGSGTLLSFGAFDDGGLLPELSPAPSGCLPQDANASRMESRRRTVRKRFAMNNTPFSDNQMK